MKTIEERAKEYASRLNQTTDEIWVDDYEYNAYIKGATDQHKIDIDRACKWINENMPVGYDIEHGNEYDMIDLKEFRKAMEG